MVVAKGSAECTAQRQTWIDGAQARVLQRDSHALLSGTAP